MNRFAAFASSATIPAARPEVSPFAIATAWSSPSTTSSVTVATRSGSFAHSCPIGASAQRGAIAAARSVPRASNALARQNVEEGRQEALRAPVDESRLRRLHTPSRSRLASTSAAAARRGGTVNVEDAAALGVRERADAVLRREARERRRRLAASTQDHEGDEVRQRDECPHPRGRPSGPGRRPTPAARCSSAGRSTWSTSVFDSPERRAARAQDDRVQALQNLRQQCRAPLPGLASKFAPIVPTGIRNSRTRSPFASVRLAISRSSGSSSAVASSWRASVGEARARPDGAGRALPRRASRAATSRSRAFDASTSVRALLEQFRRSFGAPIRPLSSLSDASAVAAPIASRSTSSQSCFTLYTPNSTRGRDASRSASREVEGTGPTTPRQPAARARCQPAEQPARIDVERRDEGENQCPPPASAAATAATSSAWTQSAPATRCWGPLEPVYDLDELRPRLHARAIAAGPPSLWRYGALLPVETPRGTAARARPARRSSQAPRLAEAIGVRELWLKLDTANPTHSFKDRVVAVACAKAQELGLQTLACSSTGNLAGAVAARAAVEGLEAAVFCPAGLEREKLAPGRRLRRDDLRGARQLRRLQPPDRRALVRAAMGVRQRRPARVLRGGLEDGRVRGRRAARLDAAGRGRLPGRVGIAVLEGRPGLRRARASSASWTARRRGSSARQARGMHAGRRGLRARSGRSRRSGRTRSRSSLAIGNPADGDHAVARRTRIRRRDPCGAGGRDRREHGAARGDVGRLRRGGGRDLPRRAARGAPAGEVGADDRSCSSSPATA